MKNFALVMGLLFLSARAHSYPKSEQIAPPPLPEIMKKSCFGPTNSASNVDLLYQI